MTIKDVTYCTTTCLNCPAAPADVYLCLQGVEVAQELCTAQTEIEDTYTRSTIPATLVDAVKSGCGYKYTFHYDTENLVGNTVLKSNNIAGVLCNGCIISVIKDTFGDEPFIDVDIETGAHYFVSNHGCRYELPTTVAGITVQDTDTVGLSLAGTVLTSDIIISPDVGNQLEERVNGLYVPANTVTSVTDTNTVNLIITGSALSADVYVSADVGNIIEQRSDGLYAASSGGTITVTDTPSVNLTLTGSDLEADVKLSATAGNQLTENVDGLYVPAGGGGSVAYSSWTPTFTYNGGAGTFTPLYRAWYFVDGELLNINIKFSDTLVNYNTIEFSIPPGYTLELIGVPYAWLTQEAVGYYQRLGQLYPWRTMIADAASGGTTITLYPYEPNFEANNTYLSLIADFRIQP